MHFLHWLTCRRKNAASLVPTSVTFQQKLCKLLPKSHYENWVHAGCGGACILTFSEKKWKQIAHLFGNCRFVEDHGCHPDCSSETLVKPQIIITDHRISSSLLLLLYIGIAKEQTKTRRYDAFPSDKRPPALEILLNAYPQDNIQYVVC